MERADVAPLVSPSQCATRRLCYLLRKSASYGFAAVSNAFAAMGAAGFVHRFNHAGFQHSARRGKGDGVSRFILKTLIQLSG